MHFVLQTIATQQVAINSRLRSHCHDKLCPEMVLRRLTQKKEPRVDKKINTKKETGKEEEIINLEEKKYPMGSLKYFLKDKETLTFQKDKFKS